MALDMLQDIWGNHSGCFWLATISPTGAIKQNPGDYPDDLDSIEEYAKLRTSQNVYFCVNLTDSREARQSRYVSRSKVVQADLDDKCHPMDLLVRPTWVVSTSTGKYQAFWVLEDYVEPELTKALNQRIAAHHRLDACVDYVRLMRLPGSLNWKYEDTPMVEIVDHRPTRYRLSDFAKYPAQRLRYRTESAVSLDSGPKYAELPELLRNQIDNYTLQAVADELEKLTSIASLQEGDRYYYRTTDQTTEAFGWERGTMWVARCLVEIANAPWNAYTLEEARYDFLTNAPTDSNWTRNDNYFKWQSALNHCCGNPVRYRKYPQLWGIE